MSASQKEKIIYELEDHIDALNTELDQLKIENGWFRDENKRLRDLIPQAWDAGVEFIRDNICNPTHMKGSPSKRVWLKQKGLA